jgi:epoxyqueuosine reductase
MKGTSVCRYGGPNDPLAMEIMRQKGLTEVPLYRSDSPKAAKFDLNACMERWMAYTPDRDGPVNVERPEGVDPDHLSTLIKTKGFKVGGSDVGFAELTPIMINVGFEFEQRNIISVIVAEDYGKVLEGALAVEEEAFEVYVECARVATELATYIRSLGFSAIADHNGTGDVQAIPTLYACGMGELGKHGSLIHPEFGPSFRPGFVITDAPIISAMPNIFGVQNTCETCRLCEQNCPPGAIRASDDFIITEGVKRWQVDIPTCYEASRFRDEYCHICVDVCPYQHKANSDPDRRTTYKTIMKKRKQAGYRTPAWFIEDEAKVLGEKG